MAGNRMNIRIDEDTQKKFDILMKRHPNLTISELIRNAVTEYMELKFKKEDLVYDIIPKLIQPIEELGYKLLEIYNLDKPIHVLLNGKLPLGIILSKNDIDIEFHLRIKESEEDIFCLFEFIKSSKQKEKIELDLIFHYYRDFNTKEFQAALKNNVVKLMENNMI